ncbi:hypothetical protein KUL49_22470 [Alteromonas sp. KUL49]|nr:protein YgfX [Alteromonas sp. KUL49]TAP39861.1 hypothetical protein EYS00_11190 [Alteromonas sp. KUL49]GEA11872.1 hypothetical protein KUL49_22470 [Alteromonas sp. KUL49]
MLPVLNTWIAFVAMPWTFWTWIDPALTLVVLFMLTLAVYSHCCLQPMIQNTVILLQDNGRISLSQSENHNDQRSCTPIEGELSPSSKLTYWGLYLKVKVLPENGQSNRDLWVLKSECSEANYRRLARIVLATQRKTNNGAT